MGVEIDIIAFKRSVLITANNITNQNATLKGNNINLNAQNTLLNQSGDITANNNLNLTAKTLTNIANGCCCVSFLCCGLLIGNIGKGLCV